MRLSFRNLILCATAFLIIIAFVYNKPIIKLVYPVMYEEYVYKYADEFNLDPLLVFSVIRAESSYDRYALSEKGAKGLMQLMDGTAIWGAESLKLEDFKVEQLFEPEINVRLGCWYLNNLRKEFNDDMKLCIIAYNAGSGKVRSWLNDEEYSNDGINVDVIPYNETDNYYKKVMKEYELLKYLYEDQ